MASASAWLPTERPDEIAEEDETAGGVRSGGVTLEIETQDAGTMDLGRQSSGGNIADASDEGSFDTSQPRARVRASAPPTGHAVIHRDRFSHDVPLWRQERQKSSPRRSKSDPTDLKVDSLIRTFEIRGNKEPVRMPAVQKNSSAHGNTAEAISGALCTPPRAQN